MHSFWVWTLNKAKKKKEIVLFFILDQSNNYLYWTNTNIDIESLLFHNPFLFYNPLNKFP